MTYERITIAELRLQYELEDSLDRARMQREILDGMASGDPIELMWPNGGRVDYDPPGESQ